MKNSLLIEIEKILKQQEVLQITLPLPRYLFVERYGRSIEKDMEQITALFEKKQWFLFRTGGRESNENILTRFLLEEERHAGLGKAYEGCVLAELSGDEDSALEEFLSYIGEHSERIRCIFTTKKINKVSGIKRLLSEDGFTRVVFGEIYDTDEQITLFMNVMECYQIRLEEDVQQEVIRFFEEKEWKETDVVEVKITNMAKSIVYQKILHMESQNMIVSKEDMNQAIRELTEESWKTRQIGFVKEA